MDFPILYAIQTLRCDILDNIILAITKIAGDYGQIWLALAVVLLIFKKTRKSGIAILIGYALVYVSGQFVLKDLIARARPCHIDETVELLISRPSSYSCPSTHSAWAFAAAISVLAYHKKAGVGVIAAALIIMFSRLYLFVHFPTDVLFGAALGAVCGYIGCLVTDFVFKKITDRKKQKA